jgi:hypothetical protein
MTSGLGSAANSHLSCIVPLYNILVLGARAPNLAHRFRDPGFSTLPKEPASAKVCVRRKAKQNLTIAQRSDQGRPTCIGYHGIRFISLHTGYNLSRSPVP